MRTIFVLRYQVVLSVTSNEPNLNLVRLACFPSCCCQVQELLVFCGHPLILLVALLKDCGSSAILEPSSPMCQNLSIEFHPPSLSERADGIQAETQQSASL